MQQTNNSREEDSALLVALQLYRLQALRHLLLVILMIQVLLLGVGLTLMLRAHHLAPTPTQSNADTVIRGRGDDKFGFEPGQADSAPPSRQVVADNQASLQASMCVTIFPDL